MRQFVHQLSIKTRGQGFYEITDSVRKWIGGQKFETGLVTIFCRHTSASLLIQENAARAVQVDLQAFFKRIAPEDSSAYTHDDEGPDDMPAHIRSAVTNVSLSIPVFGAALTLGVWQGVYLCEHRRAPHRREIALHAIGE